MKQSSPRTKVSPVRGYPTAGMSLTPWGAGQTHLSLLPPSDTLPQHSSLALWPAHPDLAFFSCSQLGCGLEVLGGGTRAPHERWWAGASGSWGVYLRRPVSYTFCQRTFGPVGSVEPLSRGCPDMMERWHSHEAGKVGSHQAECCHCSGQGRGVSEHP